MANAVDPCKIANHHFRRLYSHLWKDLYNKTFTNHFKILLAACRTLTSETTEILLMLRITCTQWVRNS
jgi:hypothetical protein